MLIPFTQPYTAPDGTTRRPLCERVPEIVPVREPFIGHGNLRLVFTPRGTWGWQDFLETEPNRCVVVDHVAAAALWRCSVEDWLLKFNRQHDLIVNVKIHKDGDLALAAMWQEAQGDEMKFQFALSPSKFKDFNAALNAAAHVIADALGIAP